MAKFLTTRGSSYEIENIINNAKNRVTLISPYVKIPDTLFQNLKVADRNNVEIILVYGKVELKPDVKNQLKQLNNLSLRFLKELHAKCFFNEKSMVITSMNLHDFSEINNKEMGILVNIKDDPDVFEKACDEAEKIFDLAKEVKLRRPFLNGAAKMAKSLLDSAIKDEPKRPRSRPYSYKSGTRLKGYCIRCGASIRHDLDKPYCPGCFSEWSVYENPDYEESSCHTCGKRARTTIGKPQCRSCYNKSPR